MGRQESQEGEGERPKVFETPGGTEHTGEGGAAPSLLLRRWRKGAVAHPGWGRKTEDCKEGPFQEPWCPDRLPGHAAEFVQAGPKGTFPQCHTYQEFTCEPSGQPQSLSLLEMATVTVKRAVGPKAGELVHRPPSRHLPGLPSARHHSSDGSCSKSSHSLPLYFCAPTWKRGL